MADELTAWRYLPGGKVKHALPHSGAVTAGCGMGVWRREYWHGTGSQAEYDECARRVPCKRCVALGYKP